MEPKSLNNYLKNENILLIIIIIGIIFSSIIFLETKTTNGFDKYEIYEIMKIIVQEPKVMNSFYPEDNYLEPAIYPEKWNNFKNLISNNQNIQQSSLLFSFATIVPFLYLCKPILAASILDGF